MERSPWGSVGKCDFGKGCSEKRLKLLVYKKFQKQKGVAMYDKNNYSVSGQSFRLRLTEEMKKFLFNKAAVEGRTVSDIMRDLVAAEMRKTK